MSFLIGEDVLLEGSVHKYLFFKSISIEDHYITISRFKTMICTSAIH